MDNTTRYVAKQIEERDIRFLRLWFSDLFGNLKSFAVVASDIEDAFEEGIGFDGSSVQGIGSTQAGSDLLVVPDAATFQVLPWRPQDNAVARMFCNIITPDGDPSPGDSRYILRTVMNRARRMGYVPMIGAEVEYYYFADATTTKPLDTGDYFDITLDNAADLRRDSILTLEQMGVPVVFSMHESEPSQHQINLHHSDALSAADAIMTSRLVIKQIAANHGVHASFMPKPINGSQGNGLYIHQSLFDDEGNNVFYDKADESGYGLSEIGKHFIAGILHYASEMSLITNQYVNSYKRLQPGFDAPTHAFWGSRKRDSLIRIPRFKPKKVEASRIELRSVDAAANPYLALAVTIAAGLDGIEKKMSLPDAFEGDVHALDKQMLQEKGIQPLPSDLSRAIEAFENSALMKDVLGEYMHAEIVKAKREEWEAYRMQVSQWEIDRYLSKL